MSISTYRIKNVWWRRLALIGAVLAIPALLLWYLAETAWDTLVEEYAALRDIPGEIRKQWSKDFR